MLVPIRKSRRFVLPPEDNETIFLFIYERHAYLEWGNAEKYLDTLGTMWRTRSKRVSGVDFKVEFAGRRAGDPAQLVVACDQVRYDPTALLRKAPRPRPSMADEEN